MSANNLIHCDRTGAALPLTAAQRGIYYAQRIDPDVPMAVAAYVEFHGRVDEERLARAVADASVETESGLLRLIANGEEEPSITVDLDRRIVLGHRDFSDQDDPAAAARRWMDDHRAHVPDLSTDPLLQTYLLDLGPGHCIWYCWGHHLAFDGYAAMYMMLRVAQRYTADAGDLPEASIASMAEIADFDDDYRNSPRFVDDLTYWSHRLRGLPEGGSDALPNTSFSTRTAAAARLATVVSQPLEPALVERIRSRAEELGVRPASVITAAVALYLAEYNDTDDAMLSLPVAARDTAALRTSAGLTSNVVPILVESGGLSGLDVAELIVAVNDDIKSALRHQHFRHEDITARVLGATSGRRGFFGPMVNVMLFFQHIDFGSLSGALNILSTGPVEDASVNVYDSMADGMTMDLEANPNVYTDIEIRTHHRRLLEFLDRFVHADPHLPAASVPLLSADENAALLASSSGARVDHGSATVTDLLAESYRRHRDRIALIGPDDTRVAFSDLEARAVSAAAGLRERGIGPDSVVGVMLPRGIDQHVALHAVLAAGAVFVALAPDEPPERLRHMLHIADPEVVIVGDDEAPVTCATTSLPRLETAGLDAATSPTAAPDPDAGAYLLFTSGSTGAPKGVLVTHRALVNRLLWMQDAYRLRPEDRVLHKTPASFDVSVWEYFWPSVAGAAIVIASPDGHRDPWYLRRVIQRHAVSALHFVPSMLAAFAEILGADAETTALTREALTSVRLLFTSGEALTAGVVEAASSLTDAAIHNLYGPTEAAIDVTHHDDCRPGTSTIPIGAPVHNTTVHVLDRRLQPLPIGAVGELYLGGVQLARGYRGRADLTADRFVADPFSAGRRLYRTGDLVRRRPDGELVYLGRRDAQVKIRGQRVELGEIENALGSLRGVRMAGAAVRDDLAADPVIVGYLTGDELDGRDLRAELTASLPAHMIPTSIMVCDELPTTANGKLDRRALPEPVLAGTDPDTDTSAGPATALDRLVHDTVCAVLGRSDLPMTASFFDLGGNSLAATRVTARLSSATGVRVGLKAVFDAADLSGISAALRAHGVSSEEPQSPAPSARVVVDGPVALSPAQHRIWLAARLDPASANSYNMPFTVRFTGDLEIGALEAALNDVVNRHQPLRTTVVDIDGEPHQQVHEVTGHLLHLERGPTATTIDDFAAEPFDLGADLPIRAFLLEHSSRDHTLVVVLHHLAADGWSLAPLADDLAQAYRARLLGRSPEWDRLPITYSQFAADRSAWLNEADSGAADQIAYWSRTLTGSPVEIELPYDRPPTRSKARTGDHVRVPIDTATRTGVFATAEAHDVTAFMVVHAVVAALLRTLTTDDDLVIGTPVSGRGDPELDHLVGMFVNTLALRTPVDKNQTFGELLSTVRERDLAAFDNSDVPFDRVVAALNPARSSSGNPFFDVSVALEDAARLSFDVDGLTATANRIDIGTGKFDLEFTVIDGAPGDGMELLLGYADELFDRVTAAGLASRCVRLLQTVTRDVDVVIGDACILDPVDRLDLIPAVGGGSRPAEHLTTLLAAAVAAEPSGTAIVDLTADRSFTYRELDAASNRLARSLVEAGAGPETYVALALPRSAARMIALWAVVKTGAAWVPVDPSYPRSRIEYILDDSGAGIVIADRQTAPAVPTDGQTVFLLDIADLDAGDEPLVDDHERHAPLAVDQPAYLIYTSGTTGRPKGVVVNHQGLADFAAEQVTRLALTTRSRTLHLASPSFDASVLEAIMAVGSAACMYIAPTDVVGGTELSELMAETGITHAFLTPSLLPTMSPDHLPQLETLVIGGEHPNAEAVRNWAPGRRLINAYGPTEVTVVATMSPSIDAADSVTIGRPIRGVSALVLDDRLRSVAPGVTGELYLSGTHLARGYHRRPSLTAGSFVANPFSATGERMYRTGDLVRWDADRSLVFRGRADHQVKVRGHRIETGEIDAELVADATVRDAVTVVAGAGDSARLVSYITGSEGTSIDVEGVRDRLARRLPRHMVPTAVIPLDEMPVTTAGKVDTRALPAPDVTGGDRDAEPPRGEAERIVADTIGRVLEIPSDRIGRDGDFFEIGGNSLLATRLAGELERRTGVRIPVRAMFDDPSVAAIAGLLAARDDHGDDRAPLRHVASTEPVAPGPAQQQLWFLNRLAGPDDAAGYHIAFALELRGELDVSALEGAMRYLIARHEPLRTRFPIVDGRPVLDVREADDIALSVTPQPIDSDEWEVDARALAARAFDLTVDEPLRVALHRLRGTPVRHRLTLVIHHIAADGVSMTPLAEDLVHAYGELAAGREPRRAAPTITYRDYLLWQRADLDRPAGVDGPLTREQALTKWWAQRLDGMSHTPLLAPDVHDPEATGRAGTVEVPLPPEIRSALRAHSPRGITDFMRMHTVLAMLIHRMSADPASHVGAQRSDVVIGTPVAGRPDVALNGLVGMFVNSVPLRVTVDSESSFLDLLEVVRTADTEAFAHADLPFAQIVAATAPPRTGRHPVFGVALVVDDLPTRPTAHSTPDLAGIEVTPLEIGTGGARFDLELSIRDEMIRFTYDVGLYTKDRVTELARSLQALMGQVADDPGRRIGDLLAASEGPTTISSGEQAPGPRHLGDIIDRAVREHPDSIAIDDGLSSVTYRDAGRITDRWARTLTGHGVLPDDVVALAIGRSMESVLATWAITKTGAAVLPIDPRHPADRVRHMLTDSGAVLGVTTQSRRPDLPSHTDWLGLDDLTADRPGALRRLRDRPARHPDGSAYVIYTSGTTGAPKGVLVSHRGLAAFAASQTHRFGVDADARTLHFASPGFDASMLELLLAVDAGATMVVAPTSIYGGDELVEFLAEQRITHAFVTPAALAAAAPRDLPALRTVGVGGEAFGRELVARWGVDRVFLNCYGPTETTIVATTSTLTPGAPITIGSPVVGVRAAILDSRLRPVPAFATGELYLMGPGLAYAYLNRPAQTASTFVAAADGTGERMYRTGDLAFADLSGIITFAGRTDRQVKVRGFRIELEEIDSVITTHPAVNAAVTVVHGSGEAAHLVTYVTGRRDLVVDELTDFVAERLPRQTTPSVIMPIDAIPVTVNGKVDRAALPTPTRDDRARSRRPETAAELALAELVGDVVGAGGAVGADDDFFELGGTSLQATTLVSRINEVHRGEPIRVRTVFDHPTVSRLAKFIDMAPTAEPLRQRTPSASPRPDRFPLAPMQKRLWSLHRSDPASLDYAMPFRLSLHGDLDVDGLRDAVTAVVDRHAVLRTVYQETDDGPVGTLADGPVHIVDARGSDPDTAIADFLAQPFDLTRDLPIRGMVTGAHPRHELILVLHHIAADGGSVPLIVDDLLSSYRTRTGPTQAETSPTELAEYRDYATSVDAARVDDDLTYWKGRLSGAPATTSVPADPSLPNQTGGGTVTLPIEPDLRDEIGVLARAESTSAFTVLHTALAILLHRLGVGDDLVVGTPVDTRATVRGLDLRRTVGMFVNSIALRTSVDGTATARSLISSVRNHDLDAWDHLTAPFDDVIAALNPARLPGRSPLVQIALSVHDFADTIADTQLPVTADLVAEIAELDLDAAKFDLQFTVTGMSSGSPAPGLAVTYARNRYSAEHATELGVRLLRVVRALIGDPERRIGDIRITDPLEVARLTPVTGAPPAPARTYAQLLDDAARRNPDGIAVRAADERGAAVEITYRELRQRADQLARWLLRHDRVRRPEAVVAVAMPRSLAAIVAIWAVVRTGAAYVPVDPTYPAERIAHMLADADVSLVLTIGEYAETLPAAEVPVVVLDDPAVHRQIGETSSAPVEDTERPRPLSVDHLAYVIYTSGSTGTPKGVLVTHLGLAAVHDDLRNRMQPDARSRVLHFASPSFDASVLEFLLAAAGAATLVVVPTGIYGGVELQTFLADEGVTHAFITPAAVATMSPDALPDLVALAVGGEAVAPDLVHSWSPARRLLNVYGPTETTIIATGSRPLAPADRVTIGHPNNGVSALVLDARLHPVPVGVPGELYLIGPQVTRGYHRRPGLTAIRYPAVPMTLGEAFAGRRMYRTGDLVRWTDDRQLEYVGRADSQVQVRGFRVELGEIDEALTADPLVRSAVTVAHSESGSTVLHSYVAGGDGALDSATLRRSLARRLPRHMVPATVTVLDQLPLTAVGKVDRQALPEPQSPPSTAGDAPIGDTEIRIAAAFEEVLGADSVHRDDSFFDLGGDSLLATTLVRRLRESGVQVGVPDVLTAPTPAELAAVRDGERTTASVLAPVLTLRHGTADAGLAPLFAIHPAIGLAWSFTALLPHLRADRPVYGLQNPMLSGASAAASIADLAADYVRRIRAVSPQGPYRLLGWSLGGLIAHEAAVQLRESGAVVEQLVILDSHVLADHPELPRNESIGDLLGEFGIDPSSVDADPDPETVAKAIRETGGALADLSPADLAAIRMAFDAAGPLASRWRPRVFDGDAIFVTAELGPHQLRARDDWLGRVSGELADIRVDCTHARMLLPQNAAQYGHVCEESSFTFPAPATVSISVRPHDERNRDDDQPVR